MEQMPKIGVAVILIKNDKVLMHKRKNSHGDGAWSFPGGHLEFKESLEDCAIRETFEETGLKIKNVRFGNITNDIFIPENKHYITIFMLGDITFGEPKIMEPDKCECWEWHDWDNMPKPLFLPIENLLKKGYRP